MYNTIKLYLFRFRYFEVNVEATDGARILNSAKITIYIMKEDEEYKWVKREVLS